MGHGLPEWFDLDGRLTGLQEIPVLSQFVAMNLGPSLDQPLLGLREFTPENLQSVQGEHASLILVVRVEVRAMVRPTNLDEHTDDDAEEP
jgi:hypothetical protein